MRFILPTLALLFIASPAFADSFSRTPSGNGTYQEMSFNVTIDDVSSCTNDWSIFGVQFDPVFAEFPLGENVLITENTHVFNTQFSSTYNVQQITAGCDGSGGSLSSLEFDGFNNLFTIEPYSAGVSFTQVPSGDVENPVSVQVTIGSPADLDPDTLTSPYWFVEIWGATNSAVLSTGCVATTDASGVYTFSGTVPFANYDTVAIAGTGAGCLSANSGEVITQSVNFTVVETPTTTPTAGAYSFVDFNDVSPTEMIASVKAGTVDTTDKVLPLLTLLGIPLGFLLVLMLIGMINKTLTPEKTGKKGRTEIINPQGDDIVYHSAKDLEFKRNYGRRKE